MEKNLHTRKKQLEHDEIAGGGISRKAVRTHVVAEVHGDRQTL
jgi:hypothetical protein